MPREKNGSYPGEKLIKKRYRNIANSFHTRYDNNPYLLPSFVACRDERRQIVTNKRRPIYRRCTPQIPINPKPHNITINHPLLADADLPCKV